MSTIDSMVEPTSVSVAEGFGKTLSGKLMQFETGQGTVWGVLVRVPVTKDIQASIKAYGQLLPEKVTQIDYLTLAPQESLDPQARTITSDRKVTFKANSYLENIAQTTHLSGDDHYTTDRPGEEIGRRLASTFGEDKQAQKLFAQTVIGRDNNKILIITGHGPGPKPEFQIGEQGINRFSDEGPIRQAPGNMINVNDLLAEITKKETYAAIVLNNCNTENQKVVATVPVFYTDGISSVAHVRSGASKSTHFIPQG